MSEGGRAVRIQLLIGFMCVALIAYFFLLWRIAWAFISSGEAAAVGLGLALMILPFIGLWVLVATLRAGLAHQRLGRIIRDEGLELDVSALPRMPSGRIQRARTTGAAGIDWHVRTTMPATARVLAKP